MRRLSPRPLFVLGLMVTFTCCLLALAACGEDTPVSGEPAAEPPETAASPDPADEAESIDFSWLPKVPDICILLVGNQKGKLKPCGCSQPQLGGLERLATLVELMRDRRAPKAFGGIALGWTLKGSGEAQEETKAALYRAALDVLEFDALLLGTPDLFVPAIAQPFLDGPERLRPRPPANAPLLPSGPMAVAADTEAFALVEIGGLKVHCASLLDPGHLGLLGGVTRGVFSPKGVMQMLTPIPEDLWLVGTDAPPSALEDVRDAIARMGPSVIVDLTGESGHTVLEDVPLGEAPMVVTLADLGKEVGVLDLFRVPAEQGGGWRASYHVYPLLPDLEERPSELRTRVTALFDAYKKEVRDRGYLASFPSHTDYEGLTYVGSGRCASCHADIYRDWLGTAHAGALRTLQDVDYHWDPECVRCHVVGFQRYSSGSWGRVESGFQSPDRTPHLGGVGCESCHGPGSAHVEDPGDEELWGPGRPNRVDPGRRGCEVCHDIENSHGFLEHYEDTYRPAVDHRRVPQDRRVGRPARVEPRAPQGR